MAGDHMYSQKGITLTFGQRERSLLCRLNQMRNDGELCDVTIIVEDQQFRCHRVVLAAFSSYFQSLFDVLNRKGFVVAVCVRLSDGDKNLKASAFAQLLDYLYTGSIRVTKQSAANIMHAANGRYFNMEEVKQACIKLLQNTGTTADNGTCTIVQNSGTLAGNGTIVQNSGALARNCAIPQNLRTVAGNGTSTGYGTIVQNSEMQAGNGTIVQNSGTQAGNGAVVQNLVTVAGNGTGTGNGTIVQNSGAQSENGTIVQNLGKSMQAGNGTIVQNSGTQAGNGTIVQNSGTQAGNGTIVQNSGAVVGNGLIVQNLGAQAGNCTIVQNSGTQAGNGTIVQNLGIDAGNGTGTGNGIIVQNSGAQAGNGAIVQNSGAQAGNGTIVQNSGAQAGNGTIVQNSGAQAGNGTIVQNSGAQAGNGTIVQKLGTVAGNGTGTGNGTIVQNSGTMQEKCTIPQNSQMPTEKCTIPQNLGMVARILQDLGTMAKNGAILQNSEKMAGNGATLPNSETMVRNSHGEETDAPASRSNDVIQKTVSINSNDGIHGEKNLHGGATYKQNEVYTSAESSQSTPLQNASCNKEKQKVPTREEACKPLSKTFESNSMQDTSSDDNNVSSSCTKVKVKEEVQEFPYYSQLPWTHDVQKKVLDADVYPFDSNPKGIKAREEDLNQFLLNELEMELGGIPTMEDLDEDPIVSTSGWMEEDPDCSEGESSEVRSAEGYGTDCGDSEGGSRKRKWSEEMLQGKKRSKRDMETSAAHTIDGSSLDSLSPANYYPLFMSRQPSAESKMPGSSPVRKDLERFKMPSNPIMFFGDFGTTQDTNLQGTVHVNKPTNMQMAVMPKRGAFPHSQNAQLKTVHNPSMGVKPRSVFMSFGDRVVARDLEVTQTSQPT
ncbi:uncharacterized protein LOC144866583 [Branchiostoma floridae x Branchiostoma japonicum]